MCKTSGAYVACEIGKRKSSVASWKQGKALGETYKNVVEGLVGKVNFLYPPRPIPRPTIIKLLPNLLANAGRCS